jgi:hypothetical protein
MAGGSLGERRGSYQSAVSLRSHPTRAEFTQDMRRCTRRGSRTKALVFPIPTTIAVRVGFSVPNRTPVIPPEQCSDTAPQPEEPLDHRGRRRASRDHHRPQVLDRSARPATREPDHPHVLQRDVMEQCMHAKGARAKFTRVDTHYRQLLLSCGLRMSLLCPRRHLDPHLWARGSSGIVGFGAETVVPVRLRRLLSHDDRRRRTTTGGGG